jgi:hypothetical protein
VGASVAGASHVRQGAACQDAHLWLVRADGLLVVAVADGAGSAVHGGVGACLAVERAVEVLDGAIASAADPAARSPAGSAGGPGAERPVGPGVDEGFGARIDARPGLCRPDLPVDAADARALMAQGFSAARRLVEEHAAASGAEAGAYACTLVCAVATPERLIAAQVGDGLLATCDPDGAWRAVLSPSRGEYANETTFLTGAVLPDGLDLGVVSPGPAAVAAITDGLLRLASDVATGRPHAPFFAPLLAWLSTLEPGAAPSAADGLAGFLRSPRVSERADDDLTLVLARRQDAV